MVTDGNSNNEQTAILPFDDGTVGRAVRREWRDGRWFFSVIDVVAILTDSVDPGAYWRKLKQRLIEEGADQTVTNCHRLKMRAIDGKLRETDAADVETMLRLAQSIPSPKAEPVKRWLAMVGAQTLDQAVTLAESENQKRLLLRGEIAQQNTALNAAANGAGVLTSRQFAVFHDAGYRGLYDGETARDIAARKGVKPGQILDHMGSDELIANLFRASVTGQRLRNDPTIDTPGAASQTHYEVGAAVRQLIIEQGGTPPEQLPTPAESIQQIERGEEQRVKAKLQPSLFDDDVSS